MKQNLFLQSIDTLDKDRIVKYHHDIRLHAGTIQNTVIQLIRKLNNGQLSLEEQKKMLERIDRANTKVLSISMFASKANFNTTGESLEGDIVQYICQYVTEVLPDFYEDLKFHCETNSISYKLKFKPLEVSLLVDNLISNSLNADAKNFSICVEKVSNHLYISFMDDGVGWSESLGQRDVFEKGVSTTSGSGLGLYNCRQYVQNELHGQVFIDKSYSSGNKDKNGVKIQIIL